MNISTVSTLCFVHVYKGIFKGQGFNFDNEVKFHIEIDKEHEEYNYILSAEKINFDRIPNDFFGKNVSSVFAIVGKNGSGKTSLFDTIIDNIGVAITAMNNEGIIYIMKKDDIYIVYSNCKNLRIDKSVETLGINFYTQEEWANSEQYKKIDRIFDNENFFNNFIYFSNNFASSYNRRHNKFIIDLSIDKQVKEIIEKADFDSNRLSHILTNSQYLKLLEFLCSDEYKKLSKFEINDLPELLKIEFKDNQKIYDLHNKFSIHFMKNFWIGKKRFSTFLNGHVYKKSDGKLEYESAINLFSICLMKSWIEDEQLSYEHLQNFIKRLAQTDSKNGIEIIKDYIEEKAINFSNLDFFQNLLYLINKNNNKYIKYYQDDKSFIIPWIAEYKNNVKNILEYFGSNNKISEYYDCSLVIEDRNGKGKYSSGEFYRGRIFLELYSAYIEIASKSSKNKNILLLIDEIDLYFHPSLQTKVINDVFKFVDSVFNNYKVQIIFTTNNPFALSDIPSSNIIYLERGNVIHKSSNTFGANINTLLKDSFFMNSTIGEFSKQKINQVVNYLRDNYDKDDYCYNKITKEEAKYIISIIGEPIVKNKLEKLYYNKFTEDIVDQEKRIQMYKEKINDLQLYITNGKILREKELDELKDRINELLVCLNKINS
ncbi:AAA family ATPase [Sedimentibacter sp. B4]|uniref:AAA family ATPase n=1 Tax=Sedimentibacter sp. B4 TaxID=304766 RepID=UPI00030F53C5|nr:AAA family ATPase [Sedimentibacter sp. B4]